MCIRRLGKLLGGVLFAAAAATAPGGTAAQPVDDPGLAEAIESLIDQIEYHAAMSAPVTGRPLLDPGVLDAMRAVPRHPFVIDEARPYAYIDIPLPAGDGLRESQPYIVAMMTDLVAPGPTDDVLILGIGGGYHAAIASRLARSVFSLDLDEGAVAAGADRLASLGYTNVEVRAADPYYGWPERGRLFDAVIIRLAVDEVPIAVLRQLRPGGRLVAPVGPSHAQQLTLFTRGADGSLSREPVLPVIFMELPGGQRI